MKFIFLMIVLCAWSSEEEKGVSPDKAFAMMVNGNARYVSGYLRKDGQAPKDRKKLIEGQKPHTIILSCSDSRVPPEVIFDQKLGEIFVVRSAGQALDQTGIASMEYALTHLGVNQIIVLGHESCGAVKAALSAVDGQSAGSVALDALVTGLQPRLMRYRGLSSTKTVYNESFTNAEGAANDLVLKSKIIADKVAAKELVIRVGLYHLASGVVEWH